MTDFYTAREFAHFIKGLGFRAFVAGSPGGDGPRGYGFITDASGERVLSFSMEQGLSGNYGPPSRESGTGWRLDKDPSDLRTAEDVRNALYSNAPQWCGRGWKHYTTLAQHLAMHGSSSGYVRLRTMRLKFFGRSVGALGGGQYYTREIIATDDRAAILAIYETHEHLVSVCEIMPDGTERKMEI